MIPCDREEEQVGRSKIEDEIDADFAAALFFLNLTMSAVRKTSRALLSASGTIVILKGSPRSVIRRNALASNS